MIAKEEKTQGIYTIKNKVNGTIYVGRSTDIDSRKSVHISQLNSGKHGNHLLQKEWQLYGRDNFEFETILEISDMSISRQIESDYILNYIKKGKGVYNISNPLDEWVTGIDGKTSPDITVLKTFFMLEGDLLNENSIYHLNYFELYVYSLLCMEKSLNNGVKFTVSLLESFAPSKIATPRDKGLIKFKESLLSLQDKKVISIINENGMPVKKLNINDPLIATFILPEEIKSKGYIHIDIDIFKKFKSLSDYYVYAAVAKWNLSPFNCTYSRWMKILGSSLTTAKKHVNQAVDNGFIYKNIGDYVEEKIVGRNQKIQGYNQYKTVPFTEKEKTSITKNIETIIGNKKFRDRHKGWNELEYHMLNFSTKRFEDMYDIYPDYEDYFFYMIIKEDMDSILDKNDNKFSLQCEFLEIAEDRIKELKNNIKFSNEWNKALKIFNREIEHIAF